MIDMSDRARHTDLRDLLARFIA